MAQKPSIPKGTRDFSPAEMARREYVFSVLRDAFSRYGFSQIQTPSFENLSTLMGKYGDEGDRLIFKILNSGDYLRDVPGEVLDEKDSQHATKYLSEKALRYDLTVPFARYVVQHQNEIAFPFKRYQMQPVWRADRPQKGRYREFYQCDADVVGSDSLINEVELVQIVDTVFARFGVRVEIKVNNRKILAAIAEKIGAADKITAVTVAIDKLDKIGIDGVRKELAAEGISDEAVKSLEPIISLSGTNAEKIAVMRRELAACETGIKGLDEVEFVLASLEKSGTANKVSLDLSLARGLNYYTGCNFEVKALDVEIGSITGGGRYDNLTGIFGMPGLSGVGISFGADRIYDVLNALDLYPKETRTATQLLFVNFGEAEAARCMELAAMARRAGIRTEVYPDAVKMKKQMSYASSRNIPFVALIGDEELAGGTVTLKNMETREQATLSPDDMIKAVNSPA